MASDDMRRKGERGYANLPQYHVIVPFMKSVADQLFDDFCRRDGVVVVTEDLLVQIKRVCIEAQALYDAGH